MESRYPGHPTYPLALLKSLRSSSKSLDGCFGSWNLRTGFGAGDFSDHFLDSPTESLRLEQNSLLEFDEVRGAAAATIALATTVSVVAVPGVLAVPRVSSGSVFLPPVMVAASFAALVMAVSGVLAVPGVGPVVVGVSGVIPASDWFGLSSQVPGVGVGEVALPGVLVVVHPRGNLRHRDRDDPRLKDWMRVNAANVLIMLFAGLSEIFSVSLSSLVPRVEVPGSVNAFWIPFLIPDSSLLKSL